jgi:hypothetical protein
VIQSTHFPFHLIIICINMKFQKKWHIPLWALAHDTNFQLILHSLFILSSNWMQKYSVENTIEAPRRQKMIELWIMNDHLGCTLTLTGIGNTLIKLLRFKGLMVIPLSHLLYSSHLPTYLTYFRRIKNMLIVSLEFSASEPGVTSENICFQVYFTWCKTLYSLTNPFCPNITG